MRIYSTLNRSKVDLTDTPSTIKLYVCGVTPYSSSHLGHAMSYVVFDVVRRYLDYKGYTVHHIQNFTDIDDKLINQSQILETKVESLSQQYINEYFEDMDALNILRAEQYPLATKEIPEIIKIIRILVEKGFAYESLGSVFFRVNSSSDYGKLSGRTLEGMLAGARIEADESKENPMDFVLWKASKINEPSWESPWGPGRPGWHIECSAMSLKYLGPHIDIHGGGNDLIFPHHENEIAQSEASTGSKPFVNIWMHNGLLQIAEDKMSKSTGKLITIREALKNFTADTIRIFFLSSHYRSPLNYSVSSLTSSGKAIERLQKTLNIDSSKQSNKPSTIDIKKYTDQFHVAMEDDFNTPKALAAIFDLSRDINKANDHGQSLGDAQSTLLQLSNILGLFLRSSDVQPATTIVESKIFALATELRERIMCEDVVTIPANLVQDLSTTTKVGSVVDILILIRTELRKDKQYALADLIRLKLTEAGIKLEDAR